MLRKFFFEQETPIKVTDTSNQNPKKDGAEHDQKKGNFRDFPMIVLYRRKTQAKGNPVLVLHGEKDGKEKDHHPKECLHPFHFSRLPFLPLFLRKRSIKAAWSF
jgi:hypothetical protein